MEVPDKSNLLSGVGGRLGLQGCQLSAGEDRGPWDEKHAALAVLHHSAAGLVLPLDRHLHNARYPALCVSSTARLDSQTFWTIVPSSLPDEQVWG